MTFVFLSGLLESSIRDKQSYNMLDVAQYVVLDRTGEVLGGAE